MDEDKLAACSLLFLLGLVAFSLGVGHLFSAAWGFLTFGVATMVITITAIVRSVE